MICRLLGLLDTLAAGVSVDGHDYLMVPRYELRDEREYEYRMCRRCHREIEQGWRRA